MQDQELLQTAARHARALAAADGRPPSATRALELYGMLLDLEGEDRARRIAIVDQMLGLAPISKPRR
jgi:hypothetical protein